MNLARVRLGLVAFSLFASAPAFADAQASLANADIGKGEKIFKRCVACHTIEKAGKNKLGPNLYGIVGKPVAQAEGYAYSPAMKAYGGEWTVERLDAYLLQPRTAVKGTKMAFAGLKKEEDRLNLIAYLNTFSEVPVGFGAAMEETASAEQTASAESAKNDVQEIEGDFGRLKVAPGVDTIFYACTACHSEMIIAQQGLTREGWDEMLDWMIDEQGMDDIPEPDRNDILDYLSTHYNEDRPNFPNPN
ncbi:c-type cytochrome [Nitratireductor kimnyeongensis]|uniref:C-type cytochrome n=1 Tax=Nitratireductor kimnyeongensis TaxID=430679 RepID=A0ABW0TDK3_9HYPH|nr:cytochrome c family protein [Nitratireductor kimnyeongensis]QZZ37691.1 cytochrome c family protein [Nitratireductor kimnyeongensis]